MHQNAQPFGEGLLNASRNSTGHVNGNGDFPFWQQLVASAITIGARPSTRMNAGPPVSTRNANCNDRSGSDGAAEICNLQVGICSRDRLPPRRVGASLLFSEALAGKQESTQTDHFMGLAGGEKPGTSQRRPRAPELHRYLDPCPASPPDPARSVSTRA